LNQKNEATLNSRFELPLALRRDRGYVYFPDALKELADRAGASWSEIQAECYKISSRRIFAETLPEHGFDRRAPGLFGSAIFSGPGGDRGFLLWESDHKIDDWFDLAEPALSLAFDGRTLEAEPSEDLFPSDFHRLALLCKKLYHHADPGGGKRMLLQRMRLSRRPAGETGIKDVISVDFLSRENFLRFSVSRNGVRVGEILGATKDPREIHD